MNEAELGILRVFRKYSVGAHQMLFVQTGFARPETSEFKEALESMIRRRLIVAERHRGAYSLTRRGYRASLQTV